MVETTKEKVKRLVPPNILARLEVAGLMVIDKHDYEITMNGYNTLANENRELRVRVMQLQSKTE